MIGAWASPVAKGEDGHAAVMDQVGCEDERSGDEMRIKVVTVLNIQRDDYDYLYEREMKSEKEQKMRNVRCCGQRKRRRESEERERERKRRAGILQKSSSITVI